MAIDSTLYALSIPSGTALTAGEVLTFTRIKGPGVVRDGYGQAVMKRVFSVGSPVPTIGHCVVKNQNWVDEMHNQIPNVADTVLAINSPCTQRCGNVVLDVNSAFEVKYVVDVATTTTVTADLFVMIDIDYPQVSAVSNPKEESGYPVSFTRADSINTTAVGTADSAPIWTTFNVDIFKAGSRYLLAEMGGRCQAAGAGIGFFSISGAASQNGLERIIPMNVASLTALRYDLDYSTPLVKGPMNINYLVMASASASATILTELDFIKR